MKRKKEICQLYSQPSLQFYGIALEKNCRGMAWLPFQKCQILSDIIYELPLPCKNQNTKAVRWWLFFKNQNSYLVRNKWLCCLCKQKLDCLLSFWYYAQNCLYLTIYFKPFTFIFPFSPKLVFPGILQQDKPFNVNKRKRRKTCAKKCLLKLFFCYKLSRGLFGKFGFHKFL